MDASDFACGDVLVKKTREGHWLPVEYISHWFSTPESDYSVINCELLAVLLGQER